MRWVPGEVWRNTLSGTSHALRYASALVIVIGALMVADMASVDSLLRQSARFQQAGGSVVVLEAPGAVDATTCEALATIPGVRTAGALRENRSPTYPLALPGGPVMTYTVTEGLVELLGAEQDPTIAGVILSDQVTDSLNLAPGDPFVTNTGRTTVRGVYSWADDGRRAGYGYALLAPDTNASGPFDQCWVDAWPAPTNLDSLVRLVVDMDSDLAPETSISRLNPNLGTELDGEGLFTGRVTRHAVGASVLAGLVIGAVSVMARRLELASARHVGVSSSAQRLQIFCETALWAGPAAIILTGVAATMVAVGSGLDDAALASVAVHAALPGLLAMLWGSQAVMFVAHERRLFGYFKQR